VITLSGGWRGSQAIQSVAVAKFILSDRCGDALWEQALAECKHHGFRARPGQAAHNELSQTSPLLVHQC
jgi:hypothetical protein